MNLIQIRQLLPGDLFIFNRMTPDRNQVGFCISNRRYEGEGGGYGQHVFLVCEDNRLTELFWRDDAVVTLCR